MYVITGGGTGIGRALAIALAARGKTVLIIGRREACLQETATHSSSISYLCADVSSAKGIDSIKDYLDSYPKISALVNNAGTLGLIEPINTLHSATWLETINTNLNAPLFLSQQLYSKLLNGRVLNIGSGAAYIPIQGWSAYCVSKAALAMLTRCWQVESQSVHFASVMPGICDTEMQNILRHATQMDPEQVSFYKRLKETDHLISPETVAEFLCWLLLEVDNTHFISKEWDIYDTSHHSAWLKLPHQVLHWDF